MSKERKFWLSDVVYSKKNPVRSYCQKKLTYTITQLCEDCYEALSDDGEYLNIPLKIVYPYFEDRLEFGDDPTILLKYLTVENIYFIFMLLISDSEILVIGNENDNVTKFITNFASLLYPQSFKKLLSLNVLIFLTPSS